MLPWIDFPIILYLCIAKIISMFPKTNGLLEKHPYYINYYIANTFFAHQITMYNYLFLDDVTPFIAQRLKLFNILVATQTSFKFVLYTF